MEWVVLRGGRGLLEGKWEGGDFPACDYEEKDEGDADQPKWQYVGELSAKTAGEEGCWDADQSNEKGLDGGVAKR